MPPRNRPNYAGASGTISPERLAKLGNAFMVQPKMDGAYCHVHLGPSGCIRRISSRSGADFGPNQTGSLIGQFVGYPNAVMIGELTAHTEAGVADALEFGAHRVHLFDMVHGYDAKPMARMPYSERRAELFRMQTRVEMFAPGQTWRQESHGIRDRASGRFCSKTHRGIALTPIVDQVRAKHVGELWDRVQSGALEGLVAVAQSAPIGHRGAKRKCKLKDTLDALVLERGGKTALCYHMGAKFFVHIARRDVVPGDYVEIIHNGWYKGGTTPRFPRIGSIRDDLSLDPSRQARAQGQTRLSAHSVEQA